jgi:hypothetical protein
VAKVYGAASVTGTEWTRATLDPTQRAGLLTQPAFLAHAALPYAGSPVKRGRFVREKLLCDRVPLAPPNLNVMPPKDDPTKQTRELYVQHATDSGCRSCHALMDPLGFAFETYDAIGRHRTTEVGRPVDASGSATLSDGRMLKFNNAVDLMKAVVAEDVARACAARAWFRFAMGRFERDEEEAAIQAGLGGFKKAGFDVRELIASLARTKAFTHRAPAEGEVLR